MPPSPKPDQAARFLLDFLVVQHPALFSVVELQRLFSGDEADAAGSLQVEEGLKELVGVGLVHRVGDFAFASHAAVSSKQLAL